MVRKYFLFVLYLLTYGSASFASLSCDKPEKDHIFSYRVRKRLAPAPINKSAKEKGIYGEKRADNLFQAAGFHICPSKHKVGNQGADGLYCMPNYKNPPTLVLHEAKYRKDGRFSLGKSNCVKCEGGREENCQQLSWKWTQNALQWIQHKCPTGTLVCNILCPQIITWALKDVRSHVIRTYSVTGDDHIVKVYAIWDNKVPGDEKASKDIISRLKSAASNLREFEAFI